MFHTKFVAKNRSVYEITWKSIVQPDGAEDDNMAHARCVLDTQGHKQTLRMYNIGWRGAD